MFVHHLLHNLDSIFWHGEVMGNFLVVYQERDQQSLCDGHFGEKKPPKNSKANLQSEKCTLKLVTAVTTPS